MKLFLIGLVDSQASQLMKIGHKGINKIEVKKVEKVEINLPLISNTIQKSIVPNEQRAFSDSKGKVRPTSEPQLANSLKEVF